jgi:hypothetical protein
MSWQEWSPISSFPLPHCKTGLFIPVFASRHIGTGGGFI